MTRIHFPFLDPARSPINLVSALRVGGLPGVIGQPGPEYSKFDKLNEEAPSTFEVVDLDNASVLIYPHLANDGPDIEKAAEEARKRNIGCIFFRWGDADEPLKVSYGTVYRHSLFTDTRYENERAMPGDVCDPQVELGLPVWPRVWKEKSKIGFCGFVSNPAARAVYRLTGRREKAAGLSLRADALRALSHSKALDCHFIMRQSYWGGARGRMKTNFAREFKPRAAFWDNVLNTDYTLCLRGAGNFSYRFYEVLAAGRIPIFINTRCVLPFEEEIDWKQHCVWIEENEIESAGEIVAKFHSRLSPDRFRTLQMANRRLWETKLSPLSFYKTAFAIELRRGFPSGELSDTERSSIAVV